jgi:hypothetical protein
MPEWAFALVVLFAVLVGASIPVLYQAAATLRAARRTLEMSGPRLERALDATAAAAAKVDAMASQLQGAVKVASAVGAAVGPAVGAAVRAFREDRGGPAPPQDAAPDGQEVTP